MPKERCAARTKRATSSVTVLQAGQEPDVRKVPSSSYVGTMCARPQQRLNFLQCQNKFLCIDFTTMTLVLTANSIMSTDGKVRLSFVSFVSDDICIYVECGSYLTCGINFLGCLFDLHLSFFNCY